MRTLSVGAPWDAEEHAARGPVDEAARLRALQRYVILDTPREQAFDDVVALTKAVTGCPLAAVAFVDQDRIWFKAGTHDVLGEIPRGEATLLHTLTGHDPVVVPDVERDPRVATGSWRRVAPDVRSLALAPLLTTDGFVLGWLYAADTVVRDLDESQRRGLVAVAHQVMSLLELRRTRLLFHMAIDGGGHVVFHVDADGRLVSVTPTWAQMTGFGAVRSLGTLLEEFVHEQDRALLRRCLRTAPGHRPVQLECRLVRLGGSEVPVEVSAHPLVDAKHSSVGMVGVISDVSTRKQAEVEAQHAQKMEALGRLSAGIAHEINTPIQFVGDNTRFLAEAYQTMLTLLLTYRRVLDAESGAMSWQVRQAVVEQAEAEADVDYLAAEVPSAVAQSLDGVERVASIIRAMKTFGHPGGAAQAPADLNENLTATLTVARNQIKYVANVVLDLGDLPPVVCHASDLNQVFLNLVVNAAQAIEEKGGWGRIGVATSCDGDEVVIAVTDTGTGIPENVGLKVFEPFFTTKEVGRGTGQGLSLALAVVRDRHGGTIRVSSVPGVGSTFTIRLPVHGLASRTDSP